MGAKRAHLQRYLGWAAVAVVILAVTGCTGDTDTDSDTDPMDLESPAGRGHGARLSATLLRGIRRRSQARAVAVSHGDRQRATCTYPTDVCRPHSRRSWDTGERSDGRVETERRRLAQPIMSFTSYAVPSTTSTSSSVASSTTTPLSTTRTTPTSSNRSRRT